MRFRIDLLLVVIFVISVATQAQKLDIDWDKKVDFSSYKTYSWGKGTPAPNPLTDQRIIAGVLRYSTRNGNSSPIGDFENIGAKIVIEYCT